MTSQVRSAAIRIAGRGGRIEVAVFLFFGILLAYDLGPGPGHVRGSAAITYLAILAAASTGLLYRIARASKAAAGIAGTGEQPGRPAR